MVATATINRIIKRSVATIEILSLTYYYLISLVIDNNLIIKELQDANDKLKDQVEANSKTYYNQVIKYGQDIGHKFLTEGYFAVGTKIFKDIGDTIFKSSKNEDKNFTTKIVDKIEFKNLLLNHFDLIEKFNELHGNKKTSQLIDLTTSLTDNHENKEMLEAILCKEDAFQTLELLMGIDSHLY